MREGTINWYFFLFGLIVLFQCAASVFRFLRIVFLKAKVIGKKILVFGNEQWVAVDIAYNIVRNGSL